MPDGLDRPTYTLTDRWQIVFPGVRSSAVRAWHIDKEDDD